jgi:hypothetical protein
MNDNELNELIACHKFETTIFYAMDMQREKRMHWKPGVRKANEENDPCL